MKRNHNYFLVIKPNQYDYRYTSIVNNTGILITLIT